MAKGDKEPRGKRRRWRKVVLWDEDEPKDAPLDQKKSKESRRTERRETGRVSRDAGGKKGARKKPRPGRQPRT